MLRAPLGPQDSATLREWNILGLCQAEKKEKSGPGSNLFLAIYQLCDLKPVTNPLWASSFLIYKMAMLKLLLQGYFEE